MNGVIKKLLVALTMVAIALPTAAAPMVKVDLNQATIEQLEALPQIGPAVARRIVEYREKSGGFRKVEELMNVRGIGEKTFARLREQISVGSAEGKDPKAAPGRDNGAKAGSN